MFQRRINQSGSLRRVSRLTNRKRIRKSRKSRKKKQAITVKEKRKNMRRSMKMRLKRYKIRKRISQKTNLKLKAKGQSRDGLKIRLIDPVRK